MLPCQDTDSLGSYPPLRTVEQHYFNSAHPKVARLIYVIKIYFVVVQTLNREQLISPPVSI